MLEGFQAGLSWSIILKRRETFRTAFGQFDPDLAAQLGKTDVERLMLDTGIIRSQAKIEATIGEAKAFVTMRDAGKDFSDFVWAFVDGVPIRNGDGVVPAKTALSERISKELKQHGFKFVGPTITDAWMQAVGLVNDHVPAYFRHDEV